MGLHRSFNTLCIVLDDLKQASIVEMFCHYTCSLKKFLVWSSTGIQWWEGVEYELSSGLSSTTYE